MLSMYALYALYACMDMDIQWEYGITRSFKVDLKNAKAKEYVRCWQKNNQNGILSIEDYCMMVLEA